MWCLADLAPSGDVIVEVIHRLYISKSIRTTPRSINAKKAQRDQFECINFHHYAANRSLRGKNDESPSF